MSDTSPTLVSLPNQKVPIAGPDGVTVSLPWYRFFQQIFTAGGGSSSNIPAEIAALQADVATAEANASAALADAEAAQTAADGAALGAQFGLQALSPALPPTRSAPGLIDLTVLGITARATLGIQSAGAPIGQVRRLNVTGSGGSVSVVGETATLNLSGGSFAAASCTATISGGAVTIQYQTNVASITYTGVGRYRVTFTTPLSNAYYGLAFAGRFPDETGPVMPIINVDSTAGYGQTTTYVDVGVETAAGVIADLAELSVLVFNAGTAPSVTYLLDSLGVAASGAYSVRQLKASATRSMNVRRDSDNTTMDIGFVSGALDTATLLSFVGSNGGWVTKWYDQSGNGNDLAQTNTNSQPQIVISGTLQTNANGKTAIFFRNGYATGLTSSASLLQSGAFTVSAAVQPNEVTSYPSFMGTPNPSYGDSVSFGVESASGNHYFSLFNDGVATSNFTTPVTALASQVLAVTSSAGAVTNTLTATGYVNNSSGGSATINTSSSVVSGTSVGVPASTTAEQWQGYMSEIIVFPSVLTSGSLTTVYTSQHGAF